MKKSPKDKTAEHSTLLTVICVIVFIFSLLLFISQFSAFLRSRRPAAVEPMSTESVQTPEPTPSPAPTPKPSPTPEPSPSPTPEVTGKTVVLTATSTEEDLYIIVRDTDGYAITDQDFTFDVTFPNGETYTYDSDPDGGCYLVRLQAGEYKVDLREKEGFLKPETLVSEVKGAVARQVISNIDAVAEVAAEAEIAYEIKSSGSGYAEEVEEISTQQEIESAEVEQIPILDENGQPTYSYSFGTDENNYLYYRGTTEPSDVILVQEEHGEAVYGLRLVVPELIVNEDGSETQPPSYYETVELLFGGDRVNEEFEITAVPLTRSAELSVGWQVINGDTYYFDSDGDRLKGLKSIDGKLYFFDDRGVKAQSLGVDVSSYNGSINWRRAKANGIDFAIIRVGGRGWTSGLMYDDSFFYTYLREAKEAGIRVGLYFYSTAIDTLEAVEEASLCVSRLRGQPLDMPIYFDTEFSGEYPNGRADLLTSSQRTEIARAFCETVTNSGYRAGVYASQNFFYSSIDYSSVCHYDIWLANYTENYTMPGFAWYYNMWQFTPGGNVSGFTGGVDMNVIF